MKYIYTMHVTPQTLIRLRRDLGWTQQKLADNLGVTNATIINWEKGHVEISRVADLAVRKLYEEHKGKAA